MSDTLIAPKYDLTKDDLRIIAEVCEETAKRGSPIALIRGPETMELLRKWFPSNSGWAKLQKLGTIRQNGNPREVKRNQRPSSRFAKHVDYLFVGSKRWPKGLPMGVTDIYEQATQESNEYKLSTSTNDVTWDEYERLRFMSDNRVKLTQRELAADSQRKDDIRSQRAEIESTTTPEERAANAAAKAMVTAMKEVMGK